MRFFTWLLHHWKPLISKALIISLVWNYGVAPAFLGHDANIKIKNIVQSAQISSITNHIQTQVIDPILNSFVAHAQNSTVPDPLITPPDQVSNAVPIVRGTKLPSQSRIIFCREGKICPDEGLVVAEGSQVNFSVSLSPLNDGRNDFAFVAEGEDGEFSDQVGFSVFFQSEASAQQNIIPADLETCLADAIADDPDAFANSRFGFPSNEPFRDNFARQSRDIFGSLPDDGRSFGAFSAFSSADDRLGSGSTDPLSEPTLLLDEINTFQERIRPDPLAGVVGVEDVFGSPVGNITGASSLRGGFFPTARRSAINTAQSKVLGGSRFFRFCVEQLKITLDLSDQTSVEIGSPISEGINTIINDVEINGIGVAGGSDKNGFFDQNGNFVLFTEQNPTVADDLAFSDIGRVFTNPGECDPTVQGNCGDEIGDKGGNDFFPGEEEEDDAGLCGDACLIGAGAALVLTAVAGFTTALTGGLVSLFAAASGLIVCPPCLIIGLVLVLVLVMFGFMCPSYYIDVDGEQRFLTNGLLTFIHKKREGRDIIHVGNIEHAQNTLNIRIKEHLDELLFINKAELLAVIHNQDTIVLQDQNNEIQDISNFELLDVPNAHTQFDFNRMDYFVQKNTNLKNHIQTIIELLPKTRAYFETKLPLLLASLAFEDRYEISIPQSIFEQEGDLKLIISGGFSPMIKKGRFNFIKGFNSEDAENFYEYINTQCIECQDATNELLDEVFGLRVQSYDFEKDEWLDVPGQLLLENQTKVFTLPEKYSSEKIRIITHKDAYIISSIGVAKNSNNSIQTIEHVAAKNVNIIHNGTTSHADVQNISKNDTNYLQIDHNDSIDITFDIDQIHQKETSLEKENQNEYKSTFFFDNTGYYELLRSLN